MMKNILVVIILVLVLGGVAYYVSQPQIKDSEIVSEVGQESAVIDFTKADYNEAIKTNKLIVLYFYANWCPICKAEFPIMQKVFNGLDVDKVIGFRVNYNDDQTDSDEKNLAREFGVAYQHTKVFVKNSQRILKSPEGWDENRYNIEISNALTQ